MAAAHRLFSLQAQAVTAGDQSATLDLKLPNVAPFAALAGQDVRGEAAIKAQIHRRGSGLALDLDAGAGISGGTAAWIGLVGNRLALKASGALSDDAVSIDRLQLSGRALALTRERQRDQTPRRCGHQRSSRCGHERGTGAATAAAGLIKDLKARWDLRVADLSILGPQFGGALQASGTLSGTPAALGADAELKSTLSIRGSPPGTVIAELHARGLPSAPSATVKVHGTVDDSPLELEAVLGRGARKGLKADIQRADWKSVHLSGTWQMESSLADSRGKLELKVGELGDFDHLLGSNMKGALDGSAVFTPQGKRTHAQFQLNGTDLVAGEFSGALHLTGEGDTDSVAARAQGRVAESHGSCREACRERRRESRRR